MDIEVIPDAVVKPVFSTVKALQPATTNILFFDLETTGLSKFISNKTFVLNTHHESIISIELYQ